MPSSKLRRLRLASQIFFFGLFMLHLLETEYRGSIQAMPGDVRFAVPYPAIFLLSDPLVAITNALSTHALYSGLLWSLTILIPTFFLGRFFCGWICPLGSMNHFFSNLKSETKRGLRRIESNRYKKWQTLKHYVLLVLLVSSLFGALTLLLLDPISLLIRSFTESVLPAANLASRAVLDSLNRTNSGVLMFLAHGLEWGLRATFLGFRQDHFRQAFLFGLILAALLAANLYVTRFWCRALCPLGALLGFLSRWSILGIERSSANCGDCNRCLLHCQGGDDPIPSAKWRKAECHLCFNCVSDCPNASIQFRFFPSAGGTLEGVLLQRRKALASLAAGVALLPALRASTTSAAERDSRLIRPPGSLDESNFLARCLRCGECMKVCPNNALQPAWSEAGLEGLWSPVLVPRIGYCEPSCVLCGQVCPTGAIWKITQAEKAWLPAAAKPGAKPISLGTAFYDRGRCLPWAMATECIVCQEWCPTSPKAIYLVEADVADPQGNIKRLRQPYVDPARCVGCGACEFACPIKGRPAVYVTSVGESRSRTNQILLQRGTKESPS
jgi:polyferredoxin